MKGGNELSSSNRESIPKDTSKSSVAFSPRIKLSKKKMVPVVKVEVCSTIISSQIFTESTSQILFQNNLPDDTIESLSKGLETFVGQ